MNQSGKVDYAFSDSELKSLALLLRQHEAILDTTLDVFKGYLESYIYRIMTIEEAEAFFDEK